MKTLVIPDIHNRVSMARKIYDRERRDVDNVIFLGDYFDNFGDDAIHSRKVALFLREMSEDTEVTFLVGNHDIGYLYPMSRMFHFCPGYSKQKADKAYPILATIDPERFQFGKFFNGVLFTHAGISNWHLFGLVATEEERTKILTMLNTGSPNSADPYFWIDKYRGGRYVFGGPMWSDFGNIEQGPFPQIVGHTPGMIPRVNGNCICLDTHLQHYGVLDNGVLIVKDSYSGETFNEIER